jgi:hypothetical protein
MHIKRVPRPIRFGLTVEAILGTIFLLFPFGLYGGHAIGFAIILLHLPALFLISFVAFVLDLENATGIAAAIVRGASAGLIMASCWAAISYLLARIFGRQRIPRQTSAAASGR